MNRRVLMVASLVLTIGLVVGAAQPAFATDGNVAQVETFMRDIIKLIAGLSGLVATGFFVVGGFIYITSTGNPERLERAKHTLFFSVVGLAIVIAAFVLSSIVTGIATSAFGN